MIWILLIIAVWTIPMAMADGHDTVNETALQTAIFALLAFGASALTSMVGLGGGLIIVPMLVFLGMSPAMAASSSLAATLANAAGASIVYARQKRICYKEALRLGVLAAPGSILGAIASAHTEPSIFGILLAVALMIASAYVYARPRLAGRSVGEGGRLLAVSIPASFLAGVVSAYFGVGGGVVFVPFLVIIVGIGMYRAAPTSMLALLVTSVVGITSHGALGHVDILPALSLSAGAVAGGIVGARISSMLGESRLRAIAVIVMAAAAVKLIWDSI